MAAPPGTYNITCRIGSVLRKTFTYENPDGTPVDLTGYTVTMPIRRSYGAAVILDGSSHITVNAEDGEMVLEIPATVTGDLRSMSGYYDLNLEPPSGAGDAFTLLTGTFTITPRVDPIGAE